MGETEIINELKRLSDVTTGLTGVITELQESNANLAGVIAELQAQIALQQISNTSLAAQLVENQATNVNLAANIAVLTAITGQLVTVNTRDLDERDTANLSLPYDDISITDARDAVPNAAGWPFAFTQADWGVPLDFYVSSLVFSFTSPDRFNYEYYQGIHIYATFGVPLEALYFRTVSASDPELTPIFRGADYRLRFTIVFPKLRKVLTGDTLTVNIVNYSGAALDFDLYINGIPHEAV